MISIATPIIANAVSPATELVLARAMKSLDPVVVLLPAHPGDLVACRALLAELSSRTHVVALVRNELRPLVSDLLLEFRCYRLSRQPGLENPLLEALLNLSLPKGMIAVDLIGMPASWHFIRTNELTAIGHYLESNDGLVPYVDTSPWCLRGVLRDDSHFGVRMLRLIPEFRQLRIWPDGVFKNAMYREIQHAGRSLGLAPGCGLAGKAKRMPPPFWSAIAQVARARDLRVVWYLGPDESDLAPMLGIQDVDRVEDGGWDSVLASHAGDEYGVTNDTCHMHIRAHMQRKTLSLFLRGEVNEWGGYPSNIVAIDASDRSVDSCIDLAAVWLLDQLHAFEPG